MTILSKKGISRVSVFPNFLALASVGLSTFFNAGLLSGYFAELKCSETFYAPQKTCNDFSNQPILFTHHESLQIQNFKFSLSKLESNQRKLQILNYLTIGTCLQVWTWSLPPVFDFGWLGEGSLNCVVATLLGRLLTLGWSRPLPCGHRFHTQNQKCDKLQE